MGQHCHYGYFFNSPSKKAAHEHRDNNSFTIFKNAPLLLDAGYYDYYGSTHYRNYYERTIAHNTICVYDSTETYTTLGVPVSNDGGQIESPTLMNYDDIFLPQHQRGKWIQFAADSTYAYNIADAQLSYDSTKLDFFRRRLLYIKPNKVIVLDHIHLKNITTHQRDVKWIAHFANKPNINGSVISTTVPGHITTYNGKTYTSTNGNGSIAIKTLLPDSSVTTLIGGTGYEYWVDGVNYPPETEPDTSFFSPGKWRIEVRPVTLTDTIIYLHTIDIGDTTDVAVAGGLAMQSIYSVGVDWDDTLYFFANDADTGKVYHVFNNVQGNRFVSIFAADLTSGSYNVLIDGIEVETVPADTNGIIKSSVYLPTGHHVVEIALNTMGTNEVTSKNTLSIYPNPAHTELNIIPALESYPFEVKIYNTRGKLVMKRYNQLRLNISDLPSGQYIVQVNQNNHCYSTKLIKQ